MMLPRLAIFLTIFVTEIRGFILTAHKLVAKCRQESLLRTTAVPSSTQDDTHEDDNEQQQQQQQQQHYVASSHVYQKDIPFLIENLDADNFDTSLEMLEPLLQSECAGEVCEDYLGMLEEKATSIGKTLPENFANPFT